MQTESHGILLAIDESDSSLIGIFLDFLFLDTGHLVSQMLLLTLEGTHLQVLREVAIVGYQSQSRSAEHLLSIVIHCIESLAFLTLHIHGEFAIRRSHGIVVCLGADSTEQQNTTQKTFLLHFICLFI